LLNRFEVKVALWLSGGVHLDPVLIWGLESPQNPQGWKTCATPAVCNTD
jgi:hypothetical protein